MSTSYAGTCTRDGITVTVLLEVSDDASYADQDELAESVGPHAVQLARRATGWRERAVDAQERREHLTCTCGHGLASHRAGNSCGAPVVSETGDMHVCVCASFTEPMPF